MPTPADLLGITGPNAVWKLQYGLPGVAGIKELSQAQLSSGSDVPGYFQISVDGKWVRVRVPVDAGTTSGSEYPRDELRQMTLAGKEAAWDSSKLDCWFEYELCPVHLPAAKPQMCVFQLHSDKDDLLEVIWQRNTAGGFELTQRVGGTSKGQPVVPHPAGVSLVLGFGLVKGVATVYRDGKPILTTSKMPQSKLTYAKLLNYLQSNSKTDKVGEYGEILARNVRTGLGAYPGPQGASPLPAPVPTPVPVPIPTPTPVPVPTVQGPVVMIIRHGEKPSDANDHTLAPKGVLRAAALPPIFTTPRADLFRPSYIFASKGTTTSMRMLQTATPTANKLALSVDTTFDSESAITQTAQRLADVALSGKVVLAVLEHSAIAAVASALVKTLGGKWNAKTPSSWSDSDFSSIWKFVGDGKGSWTFSKTDEGVLEGDPGWKKPVPPPVVIPPVVTPPPVVIPPAPQFPDAAWWAKYAPKGSPVYAAILAAIAAVLVTFGVACGTACLPGSEPAPPPPAQGRVYPVHTGIVSTTFWVGERFTDAADGSQVCSTYDSQWAYHWSGVKSGTLGGNTDCKGSPTGGCDGVPGVNKCDTEARKAPDFWPTSSAVTPKENPFYLDLPYDDINNPDAFADRCKVVPWANDAGYAGHCTDTGFSYMKNRWVKITANGQTCYGQIEDAGPGTYHDVAYVFGATNAKPANREYNSAGLDVSPAMTGCLKFPELDGENNLVSWRFVDQPPAGPWTKVVTTSGVTP